MKNILLGTDWWHDCDDCVALKILCEYVKKGEIKLEDTGAIIDRATCKKLTTEHFIVKSRVGFGTTFTIKY